MFLTIKRSNINDWHSPVIRPRMPPMKARLSHADEGETKGRRRHGKGTF